MECTTAQFLALHLPEKALAAGIIIRIALFRERLYDIAFVQKAAEDTEDSLVFHTPY